MESTTACRDAVGYIPGLVVAGASMSMTTFMSKDSSWNRLQCQRNGDLQATILTLRRRRTPHMLAWERHWIDAAAGAARVWRGLSGDFESHSQQMTSTVGRGVNACTTVPSVVMLTLKANVLVTVAGSGFATCIHLNHGSHHQ